MNRFAIALSACLLASAAQAQAETETPYIDNRSGASDVVRSLYNAINRGEYARAWSYFDEGDRPDYETFVKGYADTESVRLLLGEERTEGAAGTVYWTVPVAIESHRADGGTAVFAGCYTLAQPNAAAQAVPPFQPIAIRKGTLHPVEKPLDEAIRNGCEAD